MKISHILILTLFVGILLVLLNKTVKVNNKISFQLYGNNPLKGKYYTVNGFKMYCEIYGSGEPLLMIHENGGRINSFVKQIPFFSRSFKVIVADSRAQGKSIDHSDTLSYEQMADDFAELLNQLNIPSAHIIGWSDGGINGLELAIRHPEKVKKLVISGANAVSDTNTIDPENYKETAVRYLQLKELFSQHTEKSFNDSTEFKLNKLIIEQPNITFEELHKISSPTLVIAGDHDMIRPEHTLQLFKNIKKSSLWILPQCGHGTLIQYSNEFNAKVDSFLKQ